ncbi:unnamed protein product [Triticum turgidum subsp. durum]|uniref:Dehydrin n=1 Tax=Triticum turgidum subsp. durum TaxID=4567 RepID=A0A9R1QJI8_TRITD|nr:unnamed protein product [Triticum turgidum subsp. durum]
MAEYGGGYGHPYPRVDEYGNPVPPVDQYGNPIPREPGQVPAYSSGGASPSYGSAGAVTSADYGAGVTPGYGLSGAVHPHESVVGGAGMVGRGISTGDQIQPTKEGHTTLGETLRRSSSSSSSSSSEDDGQGGRQRKKKSMKEKIKEKLPGNHKQEEHKAGHTVPAAGTGTHEKKGIMEKIKEKLPGHH